MTSLNGEEQATVDQVAEEPADPTFYHMPKAERAALDRIIRWHAFLFHSRLFTPAILKQVFGRDIDVTAEKWSIPRNKIMENIRSYKSKLLRRMENHVTSMLKDPAIDALDKPQMILHLKAVFNADNFYDVWYYATDLVDFPEAPASEDLGKFYMESNYVNLAMVTVPIAKILVHSYSGGLGLADLRAKAQEVIIVITSHSQC